MVFYLFPIDFNAYTDFNVYAYFKVYIDFSVYTNFNVSTFFNVSTLTCTLTFFGVTGVPLFHKNSSEVIMGESISILL